MPTTDSTVIHPCSIAIHAFSYCTGGDGLRSVRRFADVARSVGGRLEIKRYSFRSKLMRNRQGELLLRELSPPALLGLLGYRMHTRVYRTTKRVR